MLTTSKGDATTTHIIPSSRNLKKSGDNGIFRVSHPRARGRKASAEATKNIVVPSLYELKEADPDLAYDLFDVEFFHVEKVKQEQSTVLKINFHSSVELVDTSAIITMNCWVRQKGTGKVLWEHNQTEHNARKCDLDEAFELKEELEPETLELTVKATWKVKSQLQEVMKTVDCTMTQGTIHYTGADHIHPVKKQPGSEPVIIDKDAEDRPPLPGDYKPSDDYIVLCFLRYPHERKDVDYMVNFGRKDRHPDGIPLFGLPGEGFPRGPEGSTFLPKHSKGICLIQPEDGNGTFLGAASASYNIEIINNNAGKFQTGNIEFLETGNNKAHYRMMSAWNNGRTYLDEAGGMATHYYHYILKLDLAFDVDGVEEIYTMTVTSVDFGSYLPGSLVYKIKPLCIMWGCLAAGTLVATARGDKCIEDIQIGDIVIGRDGQLVTVLNTWHGTEPKGLLRINMSGQSLMLTANHHVLTPEGPQRAMALKPGAKIISINGLVNVDSIEVMPEEAVIYNLTTEDAQPFFASGILVGDMTMQNSSN